MKRIIEFRGRTFNGKWVCGNLVQLQHGSYIHWSNKGMRTADEVDINTIGQFTGLYDKNGVKIYEGDILNGTIKGLLSQGYQNGIIKWGEYSFIIDLQKNQWEPGIGIVGFCSFEDYEVIGNIHEKENENEN